VRLERRVETWGTVIVVDATASGFDRASLENAVGEVEQFFFDVDRDFSTYKSDSQVSRIRRGEMRIEDASEYVHQVWALCDFSRELTLGAFDPWKAEGGFDPSGLVKGWAAEVGAQMLITAGCENVLINASGDIVLRGGKPSDKGVKSAWNIGIANPDGSKPPSAFQGSNAPSVSSRVNSHNAHTCCTYWLVSSIFSSPRRIRDTCESDLYVEKSRSTSKKNCSTSPTAFSSDALSNPEAVASTTITVPQVSTRRSNLTNRPSRLQISLIARKQLR